MSQLFFFLFFFPFFFFWWCYEVIPVVRSHCGLLLTHRLSSLFINKPNHSAARSSQCVFLVTSRSKDHVSNLHFKLKGLHWHHCKCSQYFFLFFCFWFVFFSLCDERHLTCFAAGQLRMAFSQFPIYQFSFILGKINAHSYTQLCSQKWKKCQGRCTQFISCTKYINISKYI